MVRVGSLFDLAYMTPDDTDNKTVGPRRSNCARFTAPFRVFLP